MMPTRPPREYRTSAFSRERNRMHARKTRQRKKEHMQKLQNRADELKLEQVRLKQAINEKTTANILVGLFSTGDGSAAAEAGVDKGASTYDPQVEMLLKRPTEDIPDASKIPELPALILPGQHSGKKKSGSENGDDNEEVGSSVPEELQEDGIDYALLGKDRSACSPAELDQIRRERNRMHAKRTRDRKRIFMEEMEVMIKQLEEENALLQGHIDKLNGGQPTAQPAPQVVVSTASTPAPASIISPELRPVAVPSMVCASMTISSQTRFRDASVAQQQTVPQPPPPPSVHSSDHNTKGDFLNQIESLLAAAGAFEQRRSLGELNAVSCAESDVTASTNHSDNNSFCEDDDQLSETHPNKKQRMDYMLSEVPTSVPTSITTMTTTSMASFSRL